MRRKVVCLSAEVQGHPFAPYPLFVRLEGEKVVCVGAGRCAERKVLTLLEYGAQVTVIAPEAAEGMCGLAEAGTITWLQRGYREGDLSGARLVICATDDVAVNHQVFLESQANGQFVNVVDDPANCNVIVPSVLRRGKFQVAVSTGGAAPSIARDFRRELEGKFPAWYGDYIDLVGEVRALVKQRVAGGADARRPLYEAVYASGLEERFAAGERPNAEDVYREVVVPLLNKGGAR